MLNISRRIALNFNFDMAMRGFFGIGVYTAGGRFAQVILAAVFANFGGNITNDDHRVVALQRNGSSAGVCMTGFADGAFHLIFYIAMLSKVPPTNVQT
jgi:hypothetical protein